MQKTTNYNLNKPELTDLPDITQLNPNFDTIDTELKALKDSKASDSGVVHLTGNETINGTKTFNNKIQGDISGNAGSSNDVKIVKDGVTYSLSALGGLDVVDYYTGTSTESPDTTVFLKALWQSGKLGLSNFDTWFFVEQFYYSTMSATARRTQIAYGYTKTCVFTRQYLGESDGWTAWKQLANQDELGNYVKLSGNQTVDGTKTFTANPIVTKGDPMYVAKHTGVTKGTNPSTTEYGGVNFTDTEGVSIGAVNIQYTSNGNVISSLRAYKPTLNSTDYSSVNVYYNADGTVYATAPTPASLKDDSTKIVTTAWANDKFLPFEGGTLTGAITRNGDFVKNSVNTGYVHFLGGTSDSTGSKIYLYGDNHSSMPGAVIIGSGGNTPAELQILNGVATFGGKNIVRSVNGVNADASGAVVLGKGTHIVKSGYNAYGWYREWSDGWKEQGGNHGLGGASILTFPLPFSDTSYSMVLSPRLTTTNGNSVSAVEYSHTRATTGVQISLRFGVSDNTGVFCSWYACGY